MRGNHYVKMLGLVLAALCPGVFAQAEEARAPSPIMLDLTLVAPRQLQADYRLGKSVSALYFAEELGGYRAEDWKSAKAELRWSSDGKGERVERMDGQPFDRLTFVLPIDYRELPKNYAPFSPFSDGASTLIHSGQFHACLEAPCDGKGPIVTKLDARGMVIGVEGRRTRGREQLVSRDDGTNIFVGTLEPVEADGFVAIIDPGLPEALRRQLQRSLPQSMRDLAAIYGPLAAKPELYVSIDGAPAKNGRISTQGGTLPNQVFMHFDGEKAHERLGAGEPYWVDWFFAHEAAHLFQQDKTGGAFGDDVAAWIHEGGADAMAALALAARGTAERSYALSRLDAAETACATGLRLAPLDKATAAGHFDLHYQCGLILWLALDQQLKSAGRKGLDDLNKAFFAAVRGGKIWGPAPFEQTARSLGVPENGLAAIKTLTETGLAEGGSALEELSAEARRSLESVGRD